MNTSLIHMRLEIHRALLRGIPPAELWQLVCEAAVNTGGFPLAWVGLRQGARLRPVAAAAPTFTTLTSAWPCPDIGIPALAKEVLATGAIRVCTAPVSLPPRALAAGLQSACAVPLTIAGRTRGVFEIYAEEKTFFDGGNLTLLEELAQDLEAALTRQAAEARQRRHLTRLATLAYRDPLTGLANRRGLDLHLSRTLALARRKERGLALILLDLDDFKAVNDRLGHAAGDQLLRQVASVLEQRLRQSDMPARLGGDEFAVLLPDLDNPDDVGRVACDLIEDLAQVRLPNHPGIRISASLGIALFPEHGQDPATLLCSADAALYLAKAAGRNCYRQP